jgi:hypothetical protein
MPERWNDPLSLLGPAHDAHFLLCLDSCERCLPDLYMSRGESASTHLHSFAVALGSFLLALASRTLVVPCSR